MLEVKGYIKKGEIVSLTCCANLQDILISNKSLYDILDNYFGLDVEKHFNASYDKKYEDKILEISYLILDKEPEDKNISFSGLYANITVSSIWGDYVAGCYSEWTCGFGSFDFFIRTDKGEEGHSIFKELSSFDNKWVWLNIKSERSCKIDKILSKI